MKEKKSFIALVLILLISMLPMGVLAEVEAEPDHVRIPITLVPVASEDSNNQLQQAQVITGVQTLQVLSTLQQVLLTQ